MKYYQLTQNAAIPFIQQVDIYEQYLEGKPPYVCFITNEVLFYKEYLDYMLTPFPVFSDRFKKTISLFTLLSNWDPLILVDEAEEHQELYWVLSKDVCSDFVELENKAIKISDDIPNRLENAILLCNFSRIRPNMNSLQWKIYHRNTHVLMREDLVECLLDQGCYGLCFTPIDTI